MIKRRPQSATNAGWLAVSTNTPNPTPATSACARFTWDAALDRITTNPGDDHHIYCCAACKYADNFGGGYTNTERWVDTNTPIATLGAARLNRIPNGSLTIWALTYRDTFLNTLVDFPDKEMIELYKARLLHRAQIENLPLYGAIDDWKTSHLRTFSHVCPCPVTSKPSWISRPNSSLLQAFLLHQGPRQSLLQRTPMLQPPSSQTYPQSHLLTQKNPSPPSPPCRQPTQRPQAHQIRSQRAPQRQVKTQVRPQAPPQVRPQARTQSRPRTTVQPHPQQRIEQQRQVRPQPQPWPLRQQTHPGLARAHSSPLSQDPITTTRIPERSPCSVPGQHCQHSSIREGQSSVGTFFLKHD
jgi:hypothetical protein